MPRIGVFLHDCQPNQLSWAFNPGNIALLNLDEHLSPNCPSKTLDEYITLPYFSTIELSITLKTTTIANQCFGKFNAVKKITSNFMLIN